MAGIDRDLTHLFPPFRSIVESVLEQATIETTGKHGVSHFILIEGFRPQSRQLQLYKQGRTVPGPIVTHTLHSNHTSGCAADMAPVDHEGTVLWEAPYDIWEQYGHVIRCHYGVQWGGDFPKIHLGSKFRDLPHMEATAEQLKEWGNAPRVYLRMEGLL